MKSLSRGLTLIEAVVTVAIVAVLAGVAAPNLTEFIDRQRLVTQTLAIAELAQTAKSEAIKRSATGAPDQKRVTLTVKPGTSWYVGLSNGTGACDPTGANKCELSQGPKADGTPNMVPYFIEAASSRCPGCSIIDPTATETASFDFRGVLPPTLKPGESEPTGWQGFSVQVRSPKGKLLAVAIGRLGRISVCAPGGSVIPGYPSC